MVMRGDDGGDADGTDVESTLRTRERDREHSESHARALKSEDASRIRGQKREEATHDAPGESRDESDGLVRLQELFLPQKVPPQNEFLFIPVFPNFRQRRKYLDGLSTLALTGVCPAEIEHPHQACGPAWQNELGCLWFVASPNELRERVSR
eukprot:433329-Rhodomonas_salina.4